MTDPATPRLFRINVQVGDIDRAVAFYSDLLGIEGRAAADRAYFVLGDMTIQLMRVEAPHTVPRALHFAVADLDAVHGRAAALDCLSDYDIRGTSAGVPAVRPWGERSFYAEDPWGNPVCFVDAATLYPG